MSDRVVPGAYPGRRQARLFVCALLVALPLSGCNRKQKTETGKTYTSDQENGQGERQGGAANSSGNQNNAKPLNAPADTTNGKASKASDNGTPEATRNEVVSQPGAPVERKPR